MRNFNFILEINKLLFGLMLFLCFCLFGGKFKFQFVNKQVIIYFNVVSLFLFVLFNFVFCFIVFLM